MWFPRPVSSLELRLLDGDNVSYPLRELFALLTSSDAIQRREKVGVLSPGDGSAKTTTRLLESGGYFFKTDTSQRFHSFEEVEALLAPIIATSKRASLWHPRKTWLVMQSEGYHWPLSVCPTLSTLRSIDSPDDKLRRWAEMFAMGVFMLKQHGIGLDLNPSNFGFHPMETRLYYLDDETYPFLSLDDIGTGIASRIPEQPDIQPDRWFLWGQEVQKHLLVHLTSVGEWLTLLDGLHQYPLTQQMSTKREQLSLGLRDEHPFLKRKRRLQQKKQHKSQPLFIETKAEKVDKVDSDTFPKDRVFQPLFLDDETSGSPRVMHTPASIQTFTPIPTSSQTPTPPTTSPVEIREHITPSAVEAAPETHEYLNSVNVVVQDSSSEPALEEEEPIAERLCVFSDVHGNLPAFESMLRHSKEFDVDGYLFLGDLVGYGPYPKECVQLAMELKNCQFLRGNHDEQVAKGESSEGNNRLARESLNWTVQQLNNTEREWLLSHPRELREESWLAVHSSPLDDKEEHWGYIYELTYQDALRRLKDDGLSLCFYGHTHVQFIYKRVGEKEQKSMPVTTKLFQEDETVLINPGSVGQPRDRDPRASFAIWDRTHERVTFHRVTYPVETTMKQIEKVGLPEDLAIRLEMGW